MMEYWKNGMLGFVDCVLLYYTDGMDQKIKSDHDPLLTPIFHFSTIPIFHKLPDSINHLSGVYQSQPLWARMLYFYGYFQNR